MKNSSSTGAVRILPNNKVYRQLFDAQVQLSDAYNRVRNNQLSQSLNITSRSDAVPLVRNIRPHESQKRVWLTSMSYSNDSSINPISLLFHEERKRRQNEQQQELDELKREVFNLPDTIDHIETENNTDDNTKGNVTERLATTRQTKFNQIWTEFLNKISEINQNLLTELENLTRQCNTYYEQGDKELDEQFQHLIYKKEVTSLTMKSFEHAFNHLEHLLPSRLSQIQEYCQSIEELEMERIHKIRDLFKYYSDRLYKTHHLSDKNTAFQLGKQANEFNTQIIDNRRIYTELEARLLTGETVRVHQYQANLLNYQNKWKDATWIIYKQSWISKLSQYKEKFESTVLLSCEPIGSSITEQTHLFIEHINILKTFIPPGLTRENAQKWYRQGYDIINMIVNRRKELVYQIKEIIQNEIDFLKKELEIIRGKVIQSRVYDIEQVQVVLERDIEPLFEERKLFLQETIIDRMEVIYEQLTDSMHDILDRLLAFIQPPAEQWDDHQIRLEHVTAQLLDMIREFRRPHDLQNEKKLTKLDANLDEMRSASNEKVLTRLLTSAYEQLDIIKASYAQFYDTEHSIVNKYSDMITEEVNRYRNEILDYFHARQMDTNNTDEHHSSSSGTSNHHFYTTSRARTTYELEGYSSNESDVTQKVSNSDDNGESRVSPTVRSSSGDHTRSKSRSYDQDQEQAQTFLTEDPTLHSETADIPFYETFQIPSNLFQSIMFNLCRAFLDYYDQWREETKQRTDAVMYAKHDELDKEFEFQMHLHEPRRTRIETDIHNVRAAELVMHEERVERHIRGVQETLEQTDSDYGRLLNQFAKSMNTYHDDIFSLEQVFVNATTSGRLLALQDRLNKQRDTFMDQIRITLRNFRKRFDDAMQYLRQANIKFRKSFKTFSEGGNFSREEIEVYRKKLEKTAFQIDKAETAILKEMEKLETKQLEDATKIMSQFQERFKNHLIDLQFIELTNRWISDTQVKIKGEVAINNQQAHLLTTLISSYQTRLDSVLNPNLDKQVSTLDEVRGLFHQIVLTTYERALYLKCLNNELIIPASLITILTDKGLITEGELVNDLLRVPGTDEASLSRRPSKMSAGIGSNIDEVKSVRFASSPTTTTSSQRKAPSIILVGLTGGHPEDLNTISTIRTLLHKNDQRDLDEIVEPGVPAAIDSNTRPMVSVLSSDSLHGQKPKQHENKKRSSSHKRSTGEETTPAVRQDRPSRVRTREEIYGLYCTFGEKKHTGEDFLCKIMNILRDSTEGLLTHTEMYYKEKGVRPVTRPQALREKFDEFAQIMIAKLRNYEEQCHTYHEQSINEFREMLELFEHTSPLLAKIELDEQMFQAERILIEFKQQFDMIIEKQMNEFDKEKVKNYELLRPTFGQPGKKDDLQIIDNREKIRQNDIKKIIIQLRSNTIENVQTNAQVTTDALATTAERLLILFDEILTADEITRTKLSPVKQSLSELIRRQQNGKPLEDSEPIPLIERKQGHWPGLPLFNDQSNQRRESTASKRRSSSASQQQKTSASIVTQKTTLPQIETITQRDQAYQNYKEIFLQVLANIEGKCSTTIAELDRYQLHWMASIEKLQQLRTS